METNIIPKNKEELLDLGFKLYLVADRESDIITKEKLFAVAYKFFQFLNQRYKKDSGIVHALALVERAQKKYNIAIKRLKIALKHTDTDTDKSKLLNSLGNIFFEKKDYHKALIYYRQALPLSPLKALILANIAFCFRDLNQTPAAVSYAKQAITALRIEKQVRHTSDNEPERELKLTILKKS